MELFILLFIALLPQMSFYFPPAPLLLLLLLVKWSDDRDKNTENIEDTEDTDSGGFTLFNKNDFIFNTGFDKEEEDPKPVLNIKTEGEEIHPNEFDDTPDKIDLTAKEALPVEKIIHDKFEGCTIETLLSGGSAAEGEVIFDHDGIVTIKNIDGTYYINSELIDIFS